METQNKMFPCYFQPLLCHKTQRFQFMFAHINIYALLEVFRYKTRTLLCYGKQIYISRTSYNYRQHKGSISVAYMPRGNSCNGKSNAALQLVAVRYARLIFNLMVDCDSASSSVNPSFLQQYYQVWIRGGGSLLTADFEDRELSILYKFTFSPFFASLHAAYYFF